MFETIRTCKICHHTVLDGDVSKHKQEHVLKGDVWSAPCKLNGKRSKGVCLLKEHYENCQKPDVLGRVIKNNWMCWRDGVLLETS